MDEVDQALAAFGMQRQGAAPAGCAVWPEHEQAVDLFAALLTQWRLAPLGGVIGLDYTAIPPVLDLMGIDRANWPGLFHQIRIMENEAIKVMNER